MYWLLCIMLIIFFITYAIVRDLFHPAMIMCESYLLGSLCACYNTNSWGIGLETFTIKIIVIGVMSFVIGSLVGAIVPPVKFKRANKTKMNMDSNVEKHIQIDIDNTIAWGLVILSGVIFLIYTIYWSKAIGGFKGIEFLASQMTSYRHSLSYENSVENSIPGIINHLTKIPKAIAYIFMYIDLYNSKLCKEKGLRTKFLLATSFYIPLTLMTGGRYEMIIYFITYMVMWVTIDRYYTKRKSIPLNKLFKITSAFVTIIVVFSFSRNLVGRTNESDLLKYVTTYFGGSIKLLDEYIKNPIPKSDIWGAETFYAINKFFNQIGITNVGISRHLEFREVNGIVIGNVYTSVRSMYQDFNLIGLIILQFFFGVFMTRLYKITKLNKGEKINIKVIFYCIIIHTVYLSTYSESFYNTILSVNYILFLIVLFLIVLFLIVRIIERVHYRIPCRINK